jgi:2-keto-4-pentenoate hydratase/2-oxohepta-3-ene-1,7-dioic acid hydratase in catechol pathway
MVQRYVRVKDNSGEVYYGRLNLNHSVDLLDGPPWLGGSSLDRALAQESYQLLAPCLPSKIIAVGKNYADHAAEMGSEPPSEPIIFLKPTTTVISQGQSIRYPRIATRVDYEGELALVIGQSCKDCDIYQARNNIWGYTIANDVTARDLQRSDGQWTRAKSFDTFCPLGPWIVRELNQDARIQTFLNDESNPRQSALISQMSFPPEFLVYYISQIMTLFPGDIILTGTPQGVGQMKSGDTVKVEIEGIGSLSNPVVAGLDWICVTSELDYRLPQK